MNHSTGYYPGDVVEVRDFAEIARDLDENGCLESLPFMPEMKPFCGQQVKVHRRVDKVCVEGLPKGQRFRLLPGTVMLEGLHCNGSTHGGCQRCCLLFWKAAWLRKAGSGPGSPAPALGKRSAEGFLRTQKDDGRYFCQSTQLAGATSYLRPTSFRRCAGEWQARNVGLLQACKFIWIPLVLKLKRRLVNPSFGQLLGTLHKTPVETLDLQPGELVEVKSAAEIAATLDRRGRNRGLTFTVHMLPLCGQRFVVKSRLENMIVEATGQMRSPKHTVILEGAVCEGRTVLGGCLRNSYHFWREIWLRRVSPRKKAQGPASCPDPGSPVARGRDPRACHSPKAAPPTAEKWLFANLRQGAT